MDDLHVVLHGEDELPAVGAELVQVNAGLEGREEGEEEDP